MSGGAQELELIRGGGGRRQGKGSGLLTDNRGKCFPLRYVSGARVNEGETCQGPRGWRLE